MCLWVIQLKVLCIDLKITKHENTDIALRNESTNYARLQSFLINPLLILNTSVKLAWSTLIRHKKLLICLRTWIWSKYSTIHRYQIPALVLALIHEFLTKRREEKLWNKNVICTIMLSFPPLNFTITFQ